MSDLASQTPANTFKGLLQVNDYTNGVDATAKFVQDGEGTDSALAISTTAVGIGTASPGVRLSVATNDSVMVGSFISTNTSGVSGSAKVVHIENNTATGSGTLTGLNVDISGASTATKYSAIFNGGNVGIGIISPKNKLSVICGTTAHAEEGGISLHAVNAAGNHGSNGPRADIVAKLSNNWKTNLLFKVNKLDADSAPTEAMRIDSAGKVGIGTTSPAKILTVQEVISGALSLSAFSNNSSTANSTVGIDLQTDEGEGNRTRARIVSGADGSNAGYLSLCTRKDTDGLNASIDEKMRIKNDGTINFSNVSTYANDTAAGTGGLVAGDVYKTSTGELRIKL